MPLSFGLPADEMVATAQVSRRRRWVEGRTVSGTGGGISGTGLQVDRRSRLVFSPPRKISPPSAKLWVVRPDIIVERVSGLHLFSGETDRGQEWLERQSESGTYERVGKSLAVEIERVARDLADAAIADGLGCDGVTQWAVAQFRWRKGEDRGTASPEFPGSLAPLSSATLPALAPTRSCKRFRAGAKTSASEREAEAVTPAQAIPRRTTSPVATATRWPAPPPAPRRTRTAGASAASPPTA